MAGSVLEVAEVGQRLADRGEVAVEVVVELVVDEEGVEIGGGQRRLMPRGIVAVAVCVGHGGSPSFGFRPPTIGALTALPENPPEPGALATVKLRLRTKRPGELGGFAALARGCFAT